MRSFFLLTPPMLWLMLLSSCSSAPKPPTVDGAKRHPVNSTLAIELQDCKHSLHNDRLEATEVAREADHTSAVQSQAKRLVLAIAAMQRQADTPPAGNTIYTLHFAFASTAVTVPSDISQSLVSEARSAPLIVLRGRTDGTADVASESRMARERAAAVRDYLVAAGVEATRIRTTHQPIGDHVGDNGSAPGRAANRRVEVEIYRALPVQLGSVPATH